MTRLAADLRGAALVNETVAFELNAAAVYFDRQGQQVVAQALRQQAATLLAEASRLQAKAERRPHDRSTNKSPMALDVEDEPALLESILGKLKDVASAD